MFLGFLYKYHLQENMEDFFRERETEKGEFGYNLCNHLVFNKLIMVEFDLMHSVNLSMSV